MEKSRTSLLIGAWFDGALTASEKTELEDLLRSSGEARALFWKVAETHVLLCEAGVRKACDVSRRSGAVSRALRVARCAWLKIAAAAAALFVAAAGVWHGVPRAPSPVFRLPLPAAPVTVVAGADGLELPSALPGTVRLAEGSAKVRLPSGVEMSLMGPAELRVESGMEARLEAGRLLAWVPSRASGFTVHAPGLTVWDVGTVFSVATLGGVSDVFVFKGQVQVTDAEGGGVGLCEPGEGARARAGRGAVKTAADWDAAAKLFAPVAGYRAVGSPVEAVSTAGQICDLWEARYAPTVVPGPPPPVPGLRGVGRVSPKPPRTPRGGVPTVARRVSSGAKLSQTTAAVGPPAKKENEMRGMTKTAAAVAAAATLGAGTARAETGFNAVVSGVTLTQRENTRTVDIGYTLAGEDAIITLAIETNGVAIPDSAVTRLSGAVSTVIQPGAHTITWNAGADWPEHAVTNARARVTAWSTNAPPLYCAVDVTGGPATNSYPVYYYVSAEGVSGGVTNELYKTLRILMRRIGPTGGEGFTMGSPVNETGRIAAREAQVQAVLTKGYYAGVYEVTQGQWYQVMGDTAQAWPSRWSNNDYKLTRPVEQVSYYDIRENINNTDDAAVGWPTNDAVTAGSFMGRLRSKTGLAGFDLPTEAQWEYACRAGTTGALNDGTVNITNSNSDARLDLLGRYQYNGGRINGTTDPAQGCTTANATAAVGTYAPNAWGLYDMHGNVWEWCLDWFADAAMEGGDDPDGADSGSLRVFRGGSWYNPAAACRSAFRHNLVPSNRGNDVGFRLFRTLP